MRPKHPVVHPLIPIDSAASLLPASLPSCEIQTELFVFPQCHVTAVLWSDWQHTISNVGTRKCDLFTRPFISFSIGGAGARVYWSHIWSLSPVKAANWYLTSSKEGPEYLCCLFLVHVLSSTRVVVTNSDCITPDILAVHQLRSRVSLACIYCR